MNAKEYIERAKIKYFDEKNFDGAIADLNEAIRLEPDNDSAYHMRGIVYHGKNNFDTAIADFTKAIQLRPKDGFSYFERGLTYFDKENKALAISDFEMAVKLEPQYKNFREALEDFAKIDPQSKEFREAKAAEYKKRSYELFNEGNYDEAIANLNEVIRLEPNNHYAYYMRGGAYAFKENNAQAISDLEMAVKLDPQNKDYREALEGAKGL